MKPYTVSVDIELPREKVIELFDDSDNMFHWQTGLQEFRHISGTAGQPGAVSLLTYKSGRNVIELTETITTRNLPEEFSGSYSWSSGSNTLVNRFVEVGPNQTRWESTCAYTMKSLPMKVMGFLLAGSFKKQNLKFMENFKAFAERGESVK